MSKCRYRIVNGRRYKRGASRDLKKAVAKRDKGFCRYCLIRLEKHEITLDHIVPWCKGGLTIRENLVTSCHPCNQAKGDSLIEELGWVIIPVFLLTWL